ncbi:Bifunctional NMN adenylyltransferase/Nudix hydrolase [compost metagenome]
MNEEYEDTGDEQMQEHLPVDRNGMNEEQFLRQYDANQYDRPSVTVDMLIFTVADKEQNNYRKLPEKSLQLLLIKRGEHPYLGQWALPGGFVGMNEDLDAAARRELKSETNLDDDQLHLEQLYTWGEVGRDPRTRVISCSYMALVDRSALQVQAGDDAAEASWFDLTHRIVDEQKTPMKDGYTLERLVELRLTHGEVTLSAQIKVVQRVSGKSNTVSREIVASDQLAFDHARIIQYAVDRLRNKVQYTSIAFNLMPPLFTLTELQQVYEVLLGKELLAPAFRRKIADMVEESTEYRKDAGHRPSKLFSYRPFDDSE